MIELHRRSPEDQIKYLEDRIVEILAERKETLADRDALKARVDPLQAENAALLKALTEMTKVALKENHRALVAELEDRELLLQEQAEKWRAALSATPTESEA